MTDPYTPDWLALAEREAREQNADERFRRDYEERRSNGNPPPPRSEIVVPATEEERPERRVRIQSKVVECPYCHGTLKRCVALVAGKEVFEKCDCEAGKRVTCDWEKTMGRVK